MPQIGKAGAPVTRISQAYPDRAEVRGRDLAGDLMGRLSFTEHFHLLLTGREARRSRRSTGSASATSARHREHRAAAAGRGAAQAGSRDPD
jgi:hypothetical protein